MEEVWLLNWDMAGGGAERQMIQLLQAWPDCGLKPVIVLLTRSGVLLDQLPAGTALRTLGRRRPSGLWRQGPWALATGKRLSALARSTEPAAILSFLPVPTLFARLATSFMRRRPRLIWSVQADLIGEYQQGPVRRQVPPLLRRTVLPGMDLFVACSEGIRRQLSGTFQVPDERIRVIPNAIELSRTLHDATCTDSPVLPRRAARRIITIGRCVHQKGHDRLLEAMARMRERDVELCLLGDGPLRPMLERTAQCLGLGDRVQFAGFVKNPYAWLRSADCFVSASRWEPFGIVIAEAMACGTPVVATATDGAIDLVRPMETGLLATSGEPEALAEALDTICADTPLRERLGANAAAMARTLDAPLIARQYADAIAGVL